MAVRTVWHAVFEWFEDGVRHWAYRGETVEIPDDVIEQYSRFGVFDGPQPGEPQPGDPMVGEPEIGEPDDEGVSEAAVTTPPKAATKDAWVEYAVAQGADRAVAENASKADLIKAYG